MDLFPYPIRTRQFWPKQLEKKVDDLDPTKDGEASEEPHGSTNQSKLGFKCHLHIPLYLVKGWCVQVNLDHLHWSIYQGPGRKGKILKKFRRKRSYLACQQMDQSWCFWHSFSCTPYACPSGNRDSVCLYHRPRLFQLNPGMIESHCCRSAGSLRKEWWFGNRLKTCRSQEDKKKYICIEL